MNLHHYQSQKWSGLICGLRKSLTLHTQPTHSKVCIL